MPTLKEAALAYATRGWPVFPCRRNKAPLISGGFHEATTNPEIIADWWDRWPDANIGFSPGQVGMMVVDLDAGHDPAFAGTLPKTALEQTTPSGGRHLFYELGLNETCKSPAGKVSPYVDIRSHGAYVILPPSSSESGYYRWVKQGKPAYRPDEILRLANSAREKNPERETWIIKPDLPENISRAVNWLENEAKPAIEGQGGDSATVGAAMMLRSLGASEDKALDLMLDHYNPRCEPPWDDEAMSVKVRNAYASANGQPGELTPAFRMAKVRAMFEPVPGSDNIRVAEGDSVEAPDPNAWGRYRVANRREMNLIKPPRWLVHDCIPLGGFAMLFGPPGSLKTFIALDLALSIATGATYPWAGMWGRISEPGPVLFIMGEGRTNITPRVKAWEKLHWGGKEIAEELLVIADPVPRAKDVESDDFKGFLNLVKRKSPGGYRLAVIDTVSRSMQGINENSQQDASKLTMQVELMQKVLGCAVLAIHHTGHSNGDRTKGAATFEADPDTIIRADREAKSPLVRLVMTKQKDAPEWAEPKLLEAYRFITEEWDTLAVGLPSEATIQAEKDKQSTTGGAGENEEAILGIVEKATEAVLRSVKGTAFTQKHLAGMVAAEETISIPGKMLDNKWLTLLREKRDAFPVGKQYDALTSRWKCF